MSNNRVDPHTRKLFDNFVEALESISEVAIKIARTAWYDEYPTILRDNTDQRIKKKCGITVMEDSKDGDIAYRTGQLTLALVLATQSGIRCATRDEIKAALSFWRGEVQPNLFDDGHIHGHFDKIPKWGTRDVDGNAWTLTPAGRVISDDTKRVLEAYRKSKTSYLDLTPYQNSEGIHPTGADDDEALPHIDHPTHPNSPDDPDAANDAISRDIAAIYQEYPETERESVVKSRLGQGKFRRDVLQLWNGQCAVTGTAVLEAIRASHILPWCEFREERLDPLNGLPLVATLDALFDKHLITFDSDGEMLVSSRISAEERELLDLNGKRISLKQKHQKTREYLRSHSERFEAFEAAARSRHSATKK